MIRSEGGVGRTHEDRLGMPHGTATAAIHDDGLVAIGGPTPPSAWADLTLFRRQRKRVDPGAGRLDAVLVRGVSHVVTTDVDAKLSPRFCL